MMIIERQVEASSGRRPQLFAAAKRRAGCLTLAIIDSSLALGDKLILDMHITQHVAGNFFDQIGMREFGRQQCDVALKFGTDGFKALDLKLQQAGAFDQLITNRKAVPAMKGMIGEVRTRAQAGKQHQHLPRSNAGLQSSIMRGGTQHGIFGFLRDVQEGFGGRCCYGRRRLKGE